MCVCVWHLSFLISSGIAGSESELREELERSSRQGTVSPKPPLVTVVLVGRSRGPSLRLSELRQTAEPFRKGSKGVFLPSVIGVSHRCNRGLLNHNG